VEWHHIYRINYGEFGRHGVEVYRRRTGDDGRVQGGGAIWCHGDIYGSPNKVKALISVLKMGQRKTMAMTSGACPMVCAEYLLDRFVLPGYYEVGVGVRC
jgi:hypothetical protein